MLITKRNQYALRAIFELAKHNGKGPQKISEIAQAQAIPVKFRGHSQPIKRQRSCGIQTWVLRRLFSGPSAE
jgi:hypothetical protein